MGVVVSCLPEDCTMYGRWSLQIIHIKSTACGQDYTANDILSAYDGAFMGEETMTVSPKSFQVGLGRYIC